MPRRGKELTPQMRSRLCELHTVNKWGARRIHHAHPDIPISTIHSTLRREATRDDNVSQQRPGRPKKLTDEDRDRICELVRRNPQIQYRELLEEVEHRVVRSTLSRLCNELGIRK